MATITAITAQKRNNNRVNVYLDSQYAFSLAVEAAADLTVGQQLTADDIAALEAQDEFEKAKQQAVRLISYRPRSVAEVERKLRRNNYNDALIAQVISHLQDIDLLDDEAFARYWVEQRETFKPRSRLALRQELRKKGVDRRVIESAVSNVDEMAAARRAGQKRARRYSHLPQDEFRAKLGGYLQRRGFRYEIIKPIIRELWQDLTEDRNAKA